MLPKISNWPLQSVKRAKKTPQEHFNGNKICQSAQSISVKDLRLLKI